ncbi:MAG: hypothetical protein R2939_15785 [Kofleriaceae bacterium]
MRARPTLALAVLVALGLAARAHADDTSASDKLRILYSSRFTFTPDGLPLVTVEIMGGQREVTLMAPGGLRVRPDGDGGSAVEADGGTTWVLRAEHTTPAKIQEWTVVETTSPEDQPGIAAALERWTQRGFAPRAFEVGTIFGVGGEVIDTREVRIAIDPVPAPGGEARAQLHARRYALPTTVHAELVARPTGTIVATSGTTVVRNPSVLWLQPRSTADTVTVRDVVVGGGGSQLTTSREDRRYWGSVYVTLDRDGALVAVNAVPEDKLLAGLVPAEIFPDAPEAAPTPSATPRAPSSSASSASAASSIRSCCARPRPARSTPAPAGAPADHQGGGAHPRPGHAARRRRPGRRSLQRVVRRPRRGQRSRLGGEPDRRCAVAPTPARRAASRSTRPA